MKQVWKYTAAGFAAGIVNGLFGAGGGLILVWLYRRWDPQHPKQAFACSVAVIAPLCALSFALIQLHAPVPLAPVLPYLAGGAVGGIFSGRALQRLSVTLLRRIFGLFLIYGGLSALLP